MFRKLSYFICVAACVALLGNISYGQANKDPGGRRTSTKKKAVAAASNQLAEALSSPLFISSYNPPRKWAQTLSGAEKEAMEMLANVATAKWIGFECDNPNALDAYLKEAQQAGQTPLVVIVSHPKGDGFAAMIDQVLPYFQVLGQRKAIVALAPHALETGGDKQWLTAPLKAMCACKNALVYLGAPIWDDEDVEAVSTRIATHKFHEQKIAGFAINVGGKELTTEACNRYAIALKAKFKHRSVVDTSRSGGEGTIGPLPYCSLVETQAMAAGFHFKPVHEPDVAEDANLSEEQKEEARMRATLDLLHRSGWIAAN